MPDISIIVVTWNGKKVALECLESLMNLRQGPTLEIIVVDNCSTDGTPEAIAELHPTVHLIRNSSNLGFAKANNIGIQVSHGAYIALVNSDVVVPPGCFNKIVEYLKANNDVGLLGPKMLSPDGTVGESVYRVPTVWNYLCASLGLHVLFPRSRWLGGYLMAKYPYIATDDVEVLTGWFWVVPRKAYDSVGPLDEMFFMYGEDLDWSYRFLKADWRVVFFAEAEALHYGAASSGTAPQRFHLEKVRANMQFFRKHYGRLGTIAFMFSTAIHDIMRILVNGLVYLVSNHQRGAAAFKMSRSLMSLRWITTSALAEQSTQSARG